MSLKKALVLSAVLALPVAFVSAKEKPAKAKQAVAPAATVYKVDAAQSKINWLGKKVTGQHSGTIAIKSGMIQVGSSSVVGGEILVDATSITDLDLDGEYKGKLEGHLKSDDFFGAEKNPVITFKITRVQNAPAGTVDATHVVSGDLTIKDRSTACRDR
jgi:polyisoprenoid-binding protein YceI